MRIARAASNHPWRPIVLCRPTVLRGTIGLRRPTALLALGVIVWNSLTVTIHYCPYRSVWSRIAASLLRLGTRAGPPVERPLLAPAVERQATAACLRCRGG